MNKLKFLILPIITISLCSCTTSKELNKKSFYFDTYVNTRLFEGTEDNLKDINKIFSKIDKLTDNYKARDITNVYTINNSGNGTKIEVDPDLYELYVKCSFKREENPDVKEIIRRYGTDEEDFDEEELKYLPSIIRLENHSYDDEEVNANMFYQLTCKFIDIVDQWAN